MAQKVFSKELVPSLMAYDAQRINPKDLRPDPILNGRVKLPEIAKFKRDFLDPRVGQVQPITIKKIDGLPIIVDGVTRWRAALEITEEGTGPHEGGAFYLKCQYVVAKSPADYFILTIKANIRNDPTPEDNAHNIALLIHNFMLTEADIAERAYGRMTPDGKPDVKWVRECMALNELTPGALEALKAGRLKSKAAIALAKLTPTHQTAAMKYMEDGGNLTISAIRRIGTSDGIGDISVAAPRAPRAPKPESDACGLVQQYIDMELPEYITRMTSENAVRTVLSQLKDEFKCGK